MPALRGAAYGDLEGIPTYQRGSAGLRLREAVEEERGGGLRTTARSASSDIRFYKERAGILERSRSGWTTAWYAVEVAEEPGCCWVRDAHSSPYLLSLPRLLATGVG